MHGLSMRKATSFVVIVHRTSIWLLCLCHSWQVRV